MHQVRIPLWALERGRLMNYFADIDRVRTALIAMDMQNAFTVAGQVFANPHACDIIPNVNRLAAATRAAAGTVFWTRQTISDQAPYAYPAWQFDARIPMVKKAMAALREGADGHRLHEAMQVQPEDLVVNKFRYSAFIANASELHELLQRRGIDTLIIAGTLTNVCCESSARDANMLGYKILFASDATAAVTDEEHNAALLNLCLNFADVRPTEALLSLLGQRR